jgi:hypothetical protein
MRIKQNNSIGIHQYKRFGEIFWIAKYTIFKRWKHLKILHIPPYTTYYDVQRI